MANKRESFINIKKTESIKDKINGLVGNIKQDTSYIPKMIDDDLDDVKGSLNASLNTIIANNAEQDEENISALFDLMRKNSGNEVKGNKNEFNMPFDELLDSDAIKKSLSTSFQANKRHADYDADIDEVIHFCPTLAEAINTRTSHVLNADNNNSGFLTMKNPTKSGDDLEKFNEKFDSIKTRYNLEELFTTCFKRHITYGEEYLYVINYKDAFARLMNAKDSGKRAKFNEQVTLNECVQSLEESGESFQSMELDGNDKLDMKSENNTIRLNFYPGTIPSIVTEQSNVINSITENASILESAGFSYGALMEQVEPSAKKSNSKKPKKKLSLEDPEKKEFNFTGDDGFLNTDTVIKANEIKVNGCIVKRIKSRDRLLPIYCNDVCLGYYYIECEGDYLYTNATSPRNGFSGTFGFLNRKKSNILYGNESRDYRENIMRLISKRVCDGIDKNFINNNQNFKKQIYNILSQDRLLDRQNGQVNISFLRAEDVIAFKYKIDPNDPEHRGISILDEGLVSAKIAGSIKNVTSLGILTRSMDKRVYYFQPRVDTNVSQAIMNIVNTIKKGNMGAREMLNFKNAINVVGSGKDMVIPMGRDGQPPVTFEIMPGQDIDPKTEFRESLEQEACNNIAPYEYVQSSGNTDFATRLTMTQVKMLREINQDQRKIAPIYTKTIKKIWLSEYPEDADLIRDAYVKLPSPGYLALVNNNEFLDYVIQYAEKMADVFTATFADTDNKRSARNFYIQEIVKSKLGSILYEDDLDEVIKRAQMKAETEKTPQDKEEEN